MSTSSQSDRSLRPVVFLDRDGTLNIEAGYIRDVQNLNLIQGAGEAVKKMNDAGIVCVLTTNQTGPARGYYHESHIHALHERLIKLLAEHGAKLDAIYYCPHLSPEEGGKEAPYNIACDCRKPGPGMIERAFREISGIDRGNCYVVGDKATDIDFARACSCKGILVETGFGLDVQDGKYQWRVEPDFQAGSIVEAADWIIASASARAD